MRLPSPVGWKGPANPDALRGAMSVEVSGFRVHSGGGLVSKRYSVRQRFVLSDGKLSPGSKTMINSELAATPKPYINSAIPTHSAL